MQGDLSGVVAKIDRARAHIAEFDAAQERWCGAGPFSVSPRFTSNSDADAVTIHFHVSAVEPVPRVFSTIIGDALYDLRSALDHVARQLVLANGCTPEEGAGGTQFPVCDTELTGKGARRVKVAGGIAPEALAVVDRLQPYHHSDNPAQHPLWILHSLNNIDKHRLLLLVGLAYQGVTFQLKGATYTVATEALLAEGAVLGSISLPDSQYRVNMYVDEMSAHPATLLAFGADELFCAGEPVVDVLMRLLLSVRDIVTQLQPHVMAS